MPFTFTCPYCLQKTLVSEQLSGQSGPCVGCGKSVTIPIPPQARRTDISPAEQTVANVWVQLPRRSRIPRWSVQLGLIALLVLPVIAVGAWLARPTIGQWMVQRNVTVCKQNLRRIARALNAYALDHGQYPPPFTTSATGQPMHSWRVLILPYLGERQLYEKIDFTQPWNAPQNVFAQAMMPAVYLSPANTNVAVGESSYVLLTGPGTLFPPGGPLGPQSIPDGAANTLLVVEINNRMKVWMEPYDLEFVKLAAGIGSPGGIGGTHRDGATAVTADGEPIFLPNDVPKAIIDGLITPSGGEALSGTWYK